LWRLRQFHATAATGDQQSRARLGAEFRPIVVATSAAAAANSTDVFTAFGPSL
jgi:hypothetical protein